MRYVVLTTLHCEDANPALLYSRGVNSRSHIDAVSRYRGRFAPSPTGPLHFGSLLAAAGSYLEAKAHAGEWLVRVEDLDTPRNVPGAASAILRVLEAYGFEWDGAVVYQSERGDLYRAALDRLTGAGLTFACACSRREIADSALHGVDGPVYPGTCRAGITQGRAPRATRFRVDDEPLEFHDEIQGTQMQRLETDIGDFVLRRADGLFAYQLAVVVDDDAQGVTHVMRGADLIDSTARQIALQRALQLRTPAYAHLPVALNRAGEKLSKQTQAPPLATHDAVEQLWRALDVLGQHPPIGLKQASLAELWRWARSAWRLGSVPRLRTITLRSL